MGEACDIWLASTAVAGTKVLGREVVAGTPVETPVPSGACRAGTCMGIDPIPIWTEGTEVGAPAGAMRGLAEGIAAGSEDGGAESDGGGVGPSSPAEPEPSAAGMTEVGIMVGPAAGKASGAACAAAFPASAGGSTASGGGVGGYMSGAGAALAAGAAPAWSFAPQPRQNL